MPARTNVSSTRRTVATLRRLSRLGPEHAAVVALAESTARALDEAVESDEKKYALASTARAHLLALEALFRAGSETPLDPFAAFVAGMAVPTLGIPDG
jgi:hypothetical protein